MHGLGGLCGFPSKYFCCPLSPSEQVRATTLLKASSHIRLSGFFAGYEHRAGGFRVSENWRSEEEKDSSGVETGRCSVVGCKFCGEFFPEWDQRPRLRMDFGPDMHETELSDRESNRPNRVEWFR